VAGPKRRPWWLWQKSNDARAARENVHRHYDLGNEFYRLWLDRDLVYTCAYFPTPDATLEEAQVAKMDLVCRKLGLQPGERVIVEGMQKVRPGMQVKVEKRSSAEAVPATTPAGQPEKAPGAAGSPKTGG